MTPFSPLQTSLLGPDDPLSRPSDDYYPTPPWLVEALFDELPFLVEYMTCLDAAAGKGELGKVWEHRCVHWAGVRVTAVEQDPDRAASLPGGWTNRCGDFLAWAAGKEESHSVGLCNPPFSQWREFVDALRPLCRWTAVVGFANVLGSRERAAWWRAWPPEYVLISPARPKFLWGGTDPRDTIWVVWSQDRHARTQCRWLATEDK